MAAKGTLERGIASIWQKILTVVNNALVYMDSKTAEWVHWCGSFQDVLDSGALNVFDLSIARVIYCKILWLNFLTAPYFIMHAGNC